ncbi:MAG: NAD-binding protein, partial [Chitinivibrionales bacterium]|nr:NAD-binding protein [Chitinivibrionales bacterium]
LTVYDPLSDRLEKLVSLGATAAADEKAVMQAADVVFLSMPFPDVLREVVDSKVMPHVHPGQVLVDLSTTPVAMTRALVRRCAAKGAVWLDAPISGGPEGAEAGALRVFVGGDEATATRLRPLFEVIGESNYVVYCGDSGLGQVTKAVNQLVMGLVTAGCLEALSYGVRSGVSPEVLMQAIGGDNGCRREFATVARRVAGGEGEYVHIKFGQYDEFLEHAREQGLPTPITDALHAFCDKGERRVFELPRHRRTGRKAPSFWHELQTRTRTESAEGREGET